MKHLAQKDGNRYVLPKHGDMQCDVIAFLSDALFEQSEDNVWKQAAAAACTRSATGLYLMPDTHSGYGIPVGGVLVTDDVVVQSGSGYDISCGVVYMKVPSITAADVADWDKRKRWIDEVELRVATGIDAKHPRLARAVSHRKMEEILRYGAKALGVSEELCERQYIPLRDDIGLDAVKRASDKTIGQLGSVGGGNHFIEMQVDKDSGDVYVMVHCGSRGFGWQIANHFFHAGAELRGLPVNRREESWLRMDEELGQQYWHYHNAAANYAVANRHTIVHGVREATQEVFGADVEVYYEISHNLVQKEQIRLPDGTYKEGFVHRKGATRAFPAGHPELIGTVWEKTGHPCLIPGSMYDGAAILFPESNAHASACSVNHGSGRVMSRSQAKATLRDLQKDVDLEMRNVKRTFGGVEIRGIVGNTKVTPLDECGHVYKDLDTVLAALEANGIARVHCRLYPVANLKGTD